jgi:hypothetical protein
VEAFGFLTAGSEFGFQLLDPAGGLRHAGWSQRRLDGSERNVAYRRNIKGKTLFPHNTEGSMRGVVLLAIGIENIHEVFVGWAEGIDT